MNSSKTPKQEIEERLNKMAVEIRMPLELHKKFTDMLFEAAHKVDRAAEEFGKGRDVIIKQVCDSVEKKLVKIALNEIGRRLEGEKNSYIKYHIKLETIFNILNMKG